ncbi:V-set and immunoglobulin domain-containing protein 10 [Salarias fasciatus]|uniref:Ig-like domain-containing protein n=1 Tax=Salarias fasciatus TaxID=181472 RepID=A0A672ID58_SALFA|nr:V-set and immunoglobulin domain-containing protein 10 [Salarias fasciatus]
MFIPWEPCRRVIMTIMVFIALLQLCLSATVSGQASTETAVTASTGDIVLLPCYTAGNAAPSATTWRKDGGELVLGQRLSVLPDGSLNIQGVHPGDEGSYLCTSTLPHNGSFQAAVLLQVTSGPDDVSISITGSVTPLSNGTLLTSRGSTVSFNCSGSSYPSQELTLAFSGASSSNDSLVSASGATLAFRIENIQPGHQGVYSCRAHNNISHQRANDSKLLLVYYIPDRHPDCMWTPTSNSSDIQFSCTWFGAYPPPKLRWGDNGVFQETDSLTVTLNRALLSEGKTVKCTAQHQLLSPGAEKSCGFTLKAPYPEGDPLAAALEDSSVTLTCIEKTSLPPANTTWRKGLQQDLIVPGTKYMLSEDGPELKLTILNVSKDDEGVYFCRSENPVTVRELEVYLTVRKASSAYTGAIIGVFIAALIVGSTAVVAKTLYGSRHRICLGGGFGHVNDDRGDVLSLVESDDEQVFQDTVPQLPPLTNGNHTTLVQIHRIPSSDQEDAETADTSPQQQEDTVQTHEPEDLVTF